MKTKIFFFLFLFVPVAAFSQASLPLISSSATNDGILKQGSTYSVQALSYPLQLGNVLGGAGQCGRGFVKFDLSSITFTDQDMLHSAFLVFTCGNSSNGGNASPEVLLGKPSISDIVVNGIPNEFLVYFTQLDVTSSNLLASGYLLYSYSTTYVPISLQEIISHRYGSSPQPIPISYRAFDEDSHNGIYVTNVQLLVKYYETPNAPTGLQKVGDATQTTCSLKWNASTVGPAKFYDIYDGATVVKADIPATNNPSYNLTTLSPNHTYNFKVKAKNPAGESVYSNTETVTTPAIPPTITGPSSVCYGSTVTFTINNYPPNATDTYWEKPDYLVPQAVTNSSATYTVNTADPISATVTANICAGTLLYTPKVKISGNTISLGNISGAILVGYLKTEMYSVSVTNPCNLSNRVEWTLNGDLVDIGSTVIIQSVATPPMKSGLINQEISDSNENQISRQPLVYHAIYTLKATVKNSSGTEFAFKTTDIEIYGYPLIISRRDAPVISSENTENDDVKVYPNPTSDILTMEIGVESTKATYDIRLYDGQGNLLRQQKTKGGTVQFNVSALPNGIYYLHVYDGVSDTPEMRQIVVEH